MLVLTRCMYATHVKKSEIISFSYKEMKGTGPDFFPLPAPPFLSRWTHANDPSLGRIFSSSDDWTYHVASLLGTLYRKSWIQLAGHYEGPCDYEEAVDHESFHQRLFGRLCRTRSDFPWKGQNFWGSRVVYLDGTIEGSCEQTVLTF